MFSIKFNNNKHVERERKGKKIEMTPVCFEVLASVVVLVEFCRRLNVATTTGWRLATLRPKTFCQINKNAPLRPRLTLRSVMGYGGHTVVLYLWGYIYDSVQ